MSILRHIEEHMPREIDHHWISR